MAINAVTTFWFDMLAERGVFDGRRSIIELGPQTMHAARPVVEQVVRRRAANQFDATMAAFYPDGGATFSPDAQKTFYRLFGLDAYHAIDFFAEDATYALDLNYPIDTGRKYDVVTNFGTGEHCFNIGAVFETMHNLLAPGGLAMYLLPVFGDVDHGFYNINPMLYGRLARANRYQVVDVRYLDHIYLRCLQVEDAPEDGFDFDGLPITLDDMQNRKVLARKISIQFANNLVSAETAEKVLPDTTQVPCIVFDYAYVVLRKMIDTPFVRPRQARTEDVNWYAENLA